MATHFVRRITSSSTDRSNQDSQGRPRLSRAERSSAEGGVARSGYLRMKLKHSKPISASGSAYTCPMHSDVVRSEPGKCPKCGMALVPRSSP